MHSDGNGITADHPQDRKTAGRVPLPSVQAAMPDTVPTPEDILRLLKAGYRERLAPTRWAVGLLLGKIPYIVPMVQAKQEAGGCTFFQDGLCELHAAGLKPTEGRLSHHTITMENLKFGMSLSWNVAKEWLDERNFDTIREIVRIMGK